MVNLEKEVAMIILDNPEEVASQISALDSIEEYALILKNTQIIHDTYFDTLENELQNKKLALRIREIDGKYLVTRKRDSKKTKWGVERIEIEKEWSADLFKEITAELASQGIKFTHETQYDAGLNPQCMFRVLGLEPFQHRKVHRKIREIVKKHGPTLAELDIDLVDYGFGNKEINGYVIEIESVNGDLKALQDVSKFLLTHYEQLEKWDYSKLETGKAIGKLLNENAYEKLVDASNNLTKETYDRIHNLLQNTLK